ncbi:MAG: prolyl oligopeptidase family serine peptidase [Acidobacteria bacterium]|nr:prolyl oligopeptidase family serine peptidase [Acidobacteriota bacterium]
MLDSVPAPGATPTRRRFRAGLVTRCLVVVLVAHPWFAASWAQTGEHRYLRLADYYDYVSVGSVTVAPDGSRVVFQRTHIDQEADERVTSIWSVNVDGTDLHRLVEKGSSPKFAPDGSSIAYLHSGQVWALWFGGGEPRQVSALPGRVSAFDWAPEGNRVVVVAREPRETAESTLPEDQTRAAPMIEQPPAPMEQPLDAGEWIPAEPEVQEPVVEETSPPILEAPYPVGELVPPMIEAEPARAPVPFVITRLQFKADGTGYTGVRPQHLVVDVESGSGPFGALRVTGGLHSDGSPAWSPGGGWIAFTSNRTPEPDTNNNTDIWIVAPDGGVAHRVTADPGADGAARWSPRGTHLTYRHTPLTPPVYANDRLRLVGIGGDVDVPEVGEPVELTLGLDRPLASSAHWAADQSAVFVTVQDRGTVSLVQVSTGLPRSDAESRGRGRRAPTPPAGVAAAVLAGPRDVASFAILPSGDQVVAALSTGNQPIELYRSVVAPRAGAVPLADPSAHVVPTAIPAAAELRALTNFNAGWTERVELAEAEPLRFHSTNDAVIEGWLLRPPGYREGLRYPLIVRIHGGPVAQFSWGFSWEPQWLAAQGYAVLYVNPRGSSGYGQEFAHALWADWGGPDLDDVVAGVDHLVGRGIVHPDRVGVGGWSYGGILTNYLVTRSTRFAAAVSGASETDYFACYGTDDLQRWWEDELGLPYDPTSRELYENMSPIRDVAAIETPTLFLVGEDDQRVPASQSEQMYTQLRRRMIDGGPETGLIVYPGESHGISRPSFILDRWLRYRAWYDRHLKNDAEADPFFGVRVW